MTTPVSTPEIDVHEAAARLAGGAFLLDVREPFEWERVHIDGAVLAPLTDLALDQVPADRPVLVVCRSGNRSAYATEALRAAGRDAVNVAGGILAWHRAGLPVVLGAAS